MAIACLRDLTFFFERPDRRVPLFRLCMARLTFLPAVRPYFLRRLLAAIELTPSSRRALQIRSQSGVPAGLHGSAPARPGGMSTPRKIRYAVVGAGNIAQVAVLPAFEHARDNCELVAVISGDPAKRSALRA